MLSLGAGPLLLGVMIVGAVVRVTPIAAAGFPLNDGGLFLTMARDLAESSFVPPAATTYNGIGAPFAYPPGAFYLLATLESIGLDGIALLRWLPALVSIATIPVVFAIGRRLFQSNGMGVATAAFYAVSTGSYEWLVMGGGITRSPGFLFALLGILVAIGAFRTGGWRSVVAAGALFGLTGFWHPQAAVFAGLSLLGLGVSLPGSDRRVGLRHLAAMLAIGLALALPWVALVAARHGLDPLLSAAGSGGDPFVGLVNLVSSRSSGGAVEILGIATTVALALCVVRGFWLPVVWLLAIVIVDSRAGQPYASVPAAIAIAFAIRDIGDVLRRSGSERLRLTAPAVGELGPAVVLGVILVMAAFADSVAAQRAPDSPMRAIGEDVRGAMSWVAANTEPTARFAVVSGRYWAVDAEAEWFPALSGRVSVATVQGTEWLAQAAFDAHAERAGELPVCIVREDDACVESWFAEVGPVDYLFLVDTPPEAIEGYECCHALVDLLGSVGTPEPVYSDGTVLVVRIEPGA